MGESRATAVRSTAEHECREAIYQRPTLASLLWFPGDPNVMRKRRGPHAEENFNPY